MMQKLLLLGFLFSFTVVFGQQVKVTGRCLDKKGRSLEDVQVISDKGTPSAVLTDSQGAYEFFAAFGDTVNVRYKILDLEENRTYIITSLQLQRIPDINFSIQEQIGVNVNVEVRSPFDIPVMPVVDLQKLPMSSPERFIAMTTAARSNNELTTNYNVRGGN